MGVSLQPVQGSQTTGGCPGEVAVSIMHTFPGPYFTQPCGWRDVPSRDVGTDGPGMRCAGQPHPCGVLSARRPGEASKAANFTELCRGVGVSGDGEKDFVQG